MRTKFSCTVLLSQRYRSVKSLLVSLALVFFYFINDIYHVTYASTGNYQHLKLIN